MEEDFITVTGYTTHQIFKLNYNRILSITQPVGEPVRIYLDSTDDYFRVLESVEEIENKIKKLKRNRQLNKYNNRKYF